MAEFSDSEEEEADSDMDIDVELDLATLGTEGRRQLAASAANYGLHPTDFVRLLNADQQLETELRLAKALEEEKLQLAGRKSRRARRILKERRVKERGPKLLTTKVGLLNGQPITRRTVYLSASSSDSGDYPSDEGEEQVDRTHLRKSKPTADVRARRARAKPLLTNARGPSVMIGGMTSIGLCRRRHNRGLDASEKMRKAGARSSSSSSSPSSQRSSSTFSRRSCSSSSSDRSRSSRRRRRSSSRQPSKRSRVEYITTFGTDDDEDLRSTGRLSAGASSTVSAVAASAVSRVLGCRRRSPSPTPNGSSNRVPDCRVNRPRSPVSGHYSHSNRRDSSMDRMKSHRRSSTGSSRSHERSTESRTRGSPTRPRSPRKSPSRSPLSQRLATSSSVTGHNDKRSPPGSPGSRLYEVGGANPPRRDDPPVVIRKRYYRPELESDDQSGLSTDEDEDRSNRVTERRPRETPYGRRSGAGSSYEVSAGKMTSESKPTNVASKMGLGSTATGVRLTPQELLKRRVQSQLTKAFIADKKAEQEKQLQLEQERQAREEGLRRQARLLRRQEEKRFREEQRAAALAAGNLSDYSSDSSSSSSTSGPKSSHKGAKDGKTSRASASGSSPRDGKLSPKEAKGGSAIRGAVSQRARLCSDLTTGYHSRDYDYPSPDRQSVRHRYGASPPSPSDRPGNQRWQSSVPYRGRPSGHRDFSSSHRFSRGDERSRYSGDRYRYP